MKRVGRGGGVGAGRRGERGALGDFHVERGRDRMPEMKIPRRENARDDDDSGDDKNRVY
jgi:hypothetical protein